MLRFLLGFRGVKILARFQRWIVNRSIWQFVSCNFAQGRNTLQLNKMDEQDNNHQNSTNHLNSQTHERTMEQLRWPDLQTFVNQLPSMSTIPSGTDGPAVFPPNWLPGSSFQLLRPPGVLPYNLYMGPRNSPENATSNFNQNMSFFQAQSQLQSLDTQPSQKSSSKNKTGGAKVKEHWTVDHDEDVELSVAWLKISEDPITGNSQRQATFWRRVTAEFNQQMKDKVHNHSSRTEYAATARWGIIHPAVSRWSGLHAMVTRNLESGWTVEQMESRARAMYQSKYKEMFKFERCWKVLRDSYKWKIWKERKNDVIKEGIQSVRVPPLSQEDKEYIDVDTESPLPLNSEIPRPVSPSQLESEKEQNPLFTGPASRKKPRPPGVKKAISQQERIKQKFTDQQTLLRDTISVALMGVEAKADERHKRQEELKRRRDDILDQRFEEQKRLVQTEHSITMENQKTQIMKDVKYISDELVEAYRELQALKKSSFMTPQEQFEYEMKREWVDMLQAQRAAKKRKLNLATSPVQSSEAQPSASEVSTSKITPRRLDDEDWTTNHDV